MKHLFTTAALLFSMTAFAQVGINNTSPKATLDITAKTSGTKPEGLIIPQLTGDQIRLATTATPTPVYGTAQKGLIVYASTADSAPAGATASITAPGYYYFDGSAWQKIATGNTLNTSLASGNIYVGNVSNVATAVAPTGDIAISNTGATSIGAGKVTNTHLASAAALTVKGNATNAAASPTDIAAGTDGYVLRRSGTSLGFGTVATAGIADGAVTTAKIQGSSTNGQVLTTNASGVTSWVTPVDNNTTYTGSNSINLNGTSFERTALTGDVTASANSNTTTIASNAVNSAKIADGTVANADLANMNALTVKGNATNAAASPTDIAAGTDGYVLRRSGTALGFGTVDTAGITDGAVTAAKLSQMSATSGQVLGWNGSSWTPTNVDTTNDAWINDSTNGLVKLGTKADGTTRTAGTEFVAKDNGQIGIGTSSPDANAALDVTSVNKGFLPPRVALTSTSSPSPLSAHVEGMVVYNTSTAGTAPNNVTPGIYFNDGTSWKQFTTSIQKASSYFGKVNYGDIGSGAGSKTVSGFIVSAVKTTGITGTGASNSVDDLLITHNLNISGNQNISLTILSNTTGNSYTQYNYDNDWFQPVIHDITPNSFRVFIEESYATTQNVSMMVQLTNY